MTIGARFKWAKYMRPATQWRDDWHIIKTGLPFNFEDNAIDDDIAVIVFEASVESLDTRTQKDKFNLQCLVVGFLPLTYAKRLKGTKEAGDVWDIVAVIPSDDFHSDIKMLQSRYSIFRYAGLPNIYYFAVSHFMSLMKTVTSVYLNTKQGLTTIDYSLENKLNESELTLKKIRAKVKSLQSELDDKLVDNVALQLENSELRREIARLTRKQDANKNKGYVYLLNVIGDDNLYKIGRTKNPDNRLKTFNVKLPFPVEYEFLIKTDDMYQLEYDLHNKFADKRQNGSEFFRLTNEDIEYIKLLKKSGKDAGDEW